MNGIDSIIFTAGVGENQANIRKLICEHLKWMGVELDLEANNVKSEEKEISTKNSKVKVWVIPTNEELVIARDTKAIVEKITSTY
jgi:acetate kinase